MLDDGPYLVELFSRHWLTGLKPDRFDWSGVLGSGVAAERAGTASRKKHWLLVVLDTRKRALGVLANRAASAKEQAGSCRAALCLPGCELGVLAVAVLFSPAQAGTASQAWVRTAIYPAGLSGSVGEQVPLRRL